MESDRSAKNAPATPIMDAGGGRGAQFAPVVPARHAHAGTAPLLGVQSGADGFSNATAVAAGPLIDGDQDRVLAICGRVRELRRRVAVDDGNVGQTHNAG